MSDPIKFNGDRRKLRRQLANCPQHWSLRGRLRVGWFGRIYYELEPAELRVEERNGLFAASVHYE